MSKFKRVWAMLGVVGILGALLSLAAVAPTPAGADVRPTNTINLNKIVSGTVPPAFGAGDFGLLIQCAPADVTPNDGIANPVPFTGGATFNQSGVATSTNGGVVAIDAAYTSCQVTEPVATALGAHLLPNSSTIQGFGSALTDVSIPAGFSAQVGATVTFPAGGVGGNSATFFVVNRYPGAEFNTVRVTKQTTGIVPPGAIFQINVTCDPPDVRPPTDFPAVFIGGGGTQDVQIPKDCTGIVVNEVVAQFPPTSADINGQAGFGPYAGISFAAGTVNQVRNVTVTNNYPGLTNKITIRKTVVGTPPAGVTFAGSTTCAGPGGPVTRNWAFGAAGGTTVLEFPSNVGVFPAGACQTIELPQADPADEPTSMTFNTFPVVQGVIVSNSNTASVLGWADGGGNHTATVEVINRYIDAPTHRITVNKATVGTVPAGTIFLARIRCSYDIDGAGPLGTDYFMAFGSGLPETQSFGTVLNPGDCTVTETNSGGAISRTFAAGPTSTGTTVVLSQDPGGQAFIDWAQGTTPENAQVNIVNRFNAKVLADNTLRIKKRLDGRIPAGASFTIQVRCSGGGITDTRNLTFTTNSFQEIPVPAIRSDCRVIETANGGARSVTYRASSATADVTDGPRSARVDFGTTVGGQTAKVKVRNDFPGRCPRPGPKFC